MRSPALTAACAAALLALPLWARPRVPAAPAPAWMEQVPAASRAPLLSAMRRLVSAEARQDWGSVYELRPQLDRETEPEPRFEQRWKQTEPTPILDFEPLRASPSEFAGTSEDEQVFDVLGCAQVKTDKGKAGQEGSISAHLVAGQWTLDGVHLLINDADDRPETCAFHAQRSLLASARRHR